MSRDDRIIEKGGHKFIQIKGGRLVTFWNMMGAAERAQTDFSRAFSRAFKLAVANSDPEMADYDLERAEWLIDRLDNYVHAMRHAIEEQRGTRSREDRIALLRNTTGRTPAEAAAFQRKADQLEAELRPQDGEQ